MLTSRLKCVWIFHKMLQLVQSVYELKFIIENWNSVKECPRNSKFGNKLIILSRHLRRITSISFWLLVFDALICIMFSFLYRQFLHWIDCTNRRSSGTKLVIFYRQFSKFDPFHALKSGHVGSSPRKVKALCNVLSTDKMQSRIDKLIRSCMEAQHETV